MTSAQVVETSVTNNSSFQNYLHPDDHTIRTTDTPGFKPFTLITKATAVSPMSDSRTVIRMHKGCDRTVNLMSKMSRTLIWLNKLISNAVDYWFID